MAREQDVRIARKTGIVRIHRFGEERDGRSRSERRLMRGPLLGLGAAMRVRRRMEGCGAARRLKASGLVCRMIIM